MGFLKSERIYIWEQAWGTPSNLRPRHRTDTRKACERRHLKFEVVCICTETEGRDEGC